MLAVIAFIRAFRAWLGQAWHRATARRDMRRALRQAERIFDLRPGFEPDVITVHPDQIVLEGERSCEFVRGEHGWLQIPTDDDLDRMTTQLCRVGYLDDAFLADIQYHPRIPWDLTEVERAGVEATARHAKHRPRTLAQQFLN